MRILGISAFYHDSAAALVEDGEIVAAAQEERFTRKKHDSRLPSQRDRAIAWRQAGVRRGEIDHGRLLRQAVPEVRAAARDLSRLRAARLRLVPHGDAALAREKLFQQQPAASSELKALDPGVDWNERLLFSEHHLSHAASAFYPSPFDEAAGADHGRRGRVDHDLGSHSATASDLDILREIHFPHSLGLLYSAFTYYTGFKVNSGEYKVMGLAPYGEPKYATLIRDHLIDLKADGTFRLNHRLFRLLHRPDA